MKLKIFTLFLFAVFAAAAFAQKPEVEIKKVDVPPVVDGVIDELWADVPTNNIDLNFQSELPTFGESGETTWQMVWVAEDGLYLLLVVNDDVFYPHYSVSPAGNSWEYDKPEIYFDCNYILEDDGGASSEGQPGSGHHQCAPPFNADLNDGTLLDAGIDGEADADDLGVKYAFMVNDPDYIAEYYFPLEYLTDSEGTIADISGQVGFDVTLIDRDPGDAARKRAIWANTGVGGDANESWNSMDDCGIITFEGSEPPIFIESITVTGGEITENNGTLQLVAEVLPENQTEGTIGWSVENGTGRAKITKEGLLTGIVDGTVTVTASSKYESASVDVEISNQLVSMHEINLIRNGYFDWTDTDGTATEWSGNPTEVQVVDGVLNIDPPAGGTEVWSYTVIQQKFGCNTTDPYRFSFVMWATEPDTFNVDFEDPANGYNRYGVSTHELSNGESDWTMFETPTEPTKFVFDVVFSEKLENTTESCQFMVGKHDPLLFIDSVELINENDLALITDYNPVTLITVSGGSEVPVGGTLQMSADVQPADATLTGVRWSVEAGTGAASIDADGLLTGETLGTVVVTASAKDDSQVYGVKTVTVTYGVGIEEHDVNTLMVYPNPAVNELNVVVTVENSTVTIYNSVGMIMEQTVLTGTEYIFDISDFASGIYFVRTGNAVAKFVK